MVTVAPGLYRAIAASVLSLHAAYIAWVIFGAFFTRGRRGLRRCFVNSGEAQDAYAYFLYDKQLGR